MFVEVSGEKLVGGGFLPPLILNRVNGISRKMYCGRFLD